MADQPNIIPSATGAGLNLNLNPRNQKNGQLTYALNSVVEGQDGQGISYQDEMGNDLFVSWTDGYKAVGKKAIIEQDIILLWLVNTLTGDSEIGKIQDSEYSVVINSPCLNFSIDDPIHKIFYRIVDCGTEVYWRDRNGRRFINLSKPPLKEIPDPAGCGFITTQEVDCNKLLVQPDFSIPSVQTTAVHSDGELTTGTYQFAVSYSSKNSESYTSYYSITNPLPIFDESKVTLEFNYAVNKSINLRIEGIDITGLYEYINLAVVKTVNNISSFELVGTYLIEKDSREITYTGQKIENLTEADIFEKFPIYKGADDIYSVSGVLGWQGMTEQERISYQEIASKIHLQWQTWRLKKDAYKDPIHAEHHRGYMRDEVYPFELVILLKNGKQCDGFHIPGRKPTAYDLEIISGQDVFSDEEKDCATLEAGKPRWKVYNTATKIGYAPEYNSSDPCYEGPFEYGEFAYWESEEEYDCSEAGLSGTIRHHKTPDEKVSSRFLSGGGDYIFPMGIRLDVQQVVDLLNNSSLTQEQKSQIAGFKIVRGNRAGGQKSVIAKGLLNNVGKYSYEGTEYYFPNYGEGNCLLSDPFLGNSQTENDESLTDPSKTEKRKLEAFTDESKNRFTFHSPDTHFFQPNLGNILKLESVEEGTSIGHFTSVKDHAKYSFLSTSSYATAIAIGLAAGVLGTGVDGIESTAAVNAFEMVIDILEKVIPRINYAYQYSAVGEYTSSTPIDNNGNKQRRLELSFYLEPGIVKRGEQHTINNFQRESSIYLRSDSSNLLPFSHEQVGSADNSKWTLSQEGTCDNPVTIKRKHLNTYYATIKRNIPNQWGQLYSYETIDTGFQWIGDISKPVVDRYQTVFGGDTFINQFALKRKLPFFLDHRVGAPDNSDIFYNELPNVAYPLYWMSTDAIKGVGFGPGSNPFASAIQAIFGVKANNFDCSTQKFFYQSGKFYLFHYGIPYFFCESEVNLDLRQAFNDREGDFYPHTGDGIPDEWLQEVNTTIKQDNTYHYNKTYSKQNKENFFSHLPKDYNASCETYKPLLTVYSDKDNWRIYRAISKFEFPSDRGNITSIDAISNGAILVRYENSSQIYNALLTLNTSSPQAAFLGNDTLFKGAPPIDLGFGSQHKAFIPTPYGYIVTDAKRGDIFLLQGTKVQPLSSPEVAAFFQQYLHTDTDNHFNSNGITGVWDKANERVLITKLDGTESFTLSYNFQNQSWISFHSYLPNFYVEDALNFYSSEQNGLWIHGTNFTNYHSFYGRNYDYVIEYPVNYQYQDEIFHSVKDYSQVIKYNLDGSFIYTDDWFTSAILSNDQQCSGVRKLSPKPKSSLKEASSFPKYNSDSIDILYTKSNSFYNFNTIWALNNPILPIWKPSETNLSVYRDLNQAAMNYSKNSKKAPMMAKNLKVRLINSDTDKRIISNFLTSESQNTY